MAQASSPGGPDQALVHHFIRVFGRRPTPAELARYERVRSRPALPWHARARRGMARLIMSSVPPSRH